MADKSPLIDFQENCSFSTYCSHTIRNSLHNLVNINRGKSFTVKITGKSYKIEIFARTLFSRVALKDIFAMSKICN